MGTNQSFAATIRGIPNFPEINIRSGPSTGQALVFKAPVGASGLLVLDVKPDLLGVVFEGRVYQWFQLRFPDGRQGWAREDLIDVSGDGTPFGYPRLTALTPASSLARQGFAPAAPSAPSPMAAPLPAVPPAPVQPPAPAPAPVLPTAPAPAAPPAPAPAPVPATPPPPVVVAPIEPLDLERVRLAAFNITAAFEGNGYSSYQNRDAGIVSYGRFQFTLATDGIFKLIDRYSSRVSSAISTDLRANYMERARVNDPLLRDDERFKFLLLEAAKDPVMQAAQDELAVEKYWNVVLDLSVRPRGYQLGLTLALIFDMGINFGPRHGFITRAEEESGFAPRSNVAGNVAAEQKIITRLAELRKASHDRQAQLQNLPGLRQRGDFWVNLTRRGDWNLSGDADGTLLVKPGARVKVRGF